MRPTILALLGSGMLLNSQAQIAPGTGLPLTTHLLEVNAQWAHMDPHPIGGDATVQFADEAARIATHLRMVRERLMAANTRGIGTSASARRAKLLDRIGSYADAGLFPQNHVLPYRNPVFIDPHGTACAVGWLMIESGHRELAERISNQLNLGYLREIIADPRFRDPVSEWADTHGFTADELAWIQPGYPPTVPWAPLGGGTNGAVRVLHTLANGHVLVGGEFSLAGGVAANKVAVWNGVTYAALGDGLEGDVRCAVEFEGSLFVGGSFLNGPADLAKWDGSIWTFSTVFDGKAPTITALHVLNGQLYAAGIVSGFAGNDHFVKAWDGMDWNPVGELFNGEVMALGSFNGQLVAAGAFTAVLSQSQLLVNHVAVFTGSGWIQLSNGLDATVRCLLTHDGYLYAGGDLYANIAVTFGLARLSGLATWQQVLPNHADYMPTGNGPSYISSLTGYGSSVYFGGRFDLLFLMIYGNHIGAFNGQLDGVEPLANLDQQVNAVAMAGNRLIMGGDLNASLPYVAAVDLTTGTAPAPAREEQLIIAPSPATDRTTIQLPDHVGADASVQVFNAKGAAVPVRLERQDGQFKLEVSGLAAGIHLVHVTTGDRVLSGRFIKE
jgi:hypothetical protein